MLRFYDELEKVNSIEIYLPNSGEKESLLIPNCYYINPLGILYNGFGKNGHKEANLLYTYKLIKDSFYDKRKITLDGNDKISLPSVLVEEMKTYKRIKKANSVTESDVKKYLHLDVCNLKNPIVIDLIVGIVSSKIVLLNKFIELQNKSDDIILDIEKIIELSNDDINDILVRYCDFHKIDSQPNKTITTSSLNLNSFINYLEKGWTVELVPKISINGSTDELHETLVVDSFLENRPEYRNKIKMKIKQLSLH